MLPLFEFGWIRMRGVKPFIFLALSCFSAGLPLLHHHCCRVQPLSYFDILTFQPIYSKKPFSKELAYHLLAFQCSTGQPTKIIISTCVRENVNVMFSYQWNLCFYFFPSNLSSARHVRFFSVMVSHTVLTSSIQWSFQPFWL